MKQIVHKHEWFIHMSTHVNRVSCQETLNSAMIICSKMYSALRRSLGDIPRSCVMWVCDWGPKDSPWQWAMKTGVDFLSRACAHLCDWLWAVCILLCLSFLPWPNPSPTKSFMNAFLFLCCFKGCSLFLAPFCYFFALLGKHPHSFKSRSNTTCSCVNRILHTSLISIHSIIWHFLSLCLEYVRPVLSLPIPPKHISLFWLVKARTVFLIHLCVLNISPMFSTEYLLLTACLVNEWNAVSSELCQITPQGPF
jgi:hypothetical protein